MDEQQQKKVGALGALDERLGSTPGIGAWSFYYRLGFTAGDDPRKRAGIVAVKKALIAAGFSKGIDLSMYVFGNAVTSRTKEFQEAHAIGADGVVGPKTARILWRPYIAQAETDGGIPNHWLGRIATGESNNDPVAEGIVDAEDEGLVQIHLPFHPEVTLAEAWDPDFSAFWAGQHLASDFRYVGSWRGAVAAHNIGRTYAKQWVEAEYPATGGPSMGTDANGNTVFAFERATAYVRYIGSLQY